MSKDLTCLLQEWRYDPDEMSVRIVLGDDGREKIQQRVDLGVLQMEMDGRPDGDRPGGCESWLDYYEQKQRAYDTAHPDSAAFSLSEEDCGRLWREGVQYYHRYLSCWHLDRYEPCARDTKRNLRLFAFVCKHTEEDRAKLQFDQWRPYVTMMYARAVATPLVQQEKFEEVLQVIDAGIDAIRDFLEEYQQAHRAEECVELVSLERWHEEVAALQKESRIPPRKSEIEALREKLEAAVAAEEFEEAARLRDKIRRMREKKKGGG